MRASIWKGDVASITQLQVAVMNNCTCEHDDAGRVSGQCSAHQAMLDQRFVDGILFGRWLLERLLAEEFT